MVIFSQTMVFVWQYFKSKCNSCEFCKTTKIKYCEDYELHVLKKYCIPAHIDFQNIGSWKYWYLNWKAWNKNETSKIFVICFSSKTKIAFPKFCFWKDGHDNFLHEVILKENRELRSVILWMQNHLTRFLLRKTFYESHFRWIFKLLVNKGYTYR